MSGTLTLGIIKPDAIQRNLTGSILAHIERAGFRLRAARMVQLSRGQAEAFYDVHRGRPFFDELVAFMSSSPCLALVLERENAVAAFRETIGATDPAAAAEGTVRRRFAESTSRNAVHGSDSDATAAREIAFFFSEAELTALGVGR